MKIKSIEIKNKPPLFNFLVDNLQDVVILAGPNGVGKTRLLESIRSAFSCLHYQKEEDKDKDNILELIPTCEKEKESWGKEPMSTFDSLEIRMKIHDFAIYESPRRSITSTLLYISSPRPSLAKFEFPALNTNREDTREDTIGFSETTSCIDARFKDTIHHLYKEIGHYHFQIVKNHEKKRNIGGDQMKVIKTDPMKKYRDIFNSLLAPKELLEIDIDLDEPPIQYMDHGKKLDIQSLSSGEKQVLIVVLDFYFHNPQHCIILFDEPELHLHSKLALRLVDTLVKIGSNNQFFFTTHSGEILSHFTNRASILAITPSTNGENQARQIEIEKGEENNPILEFLGNQLGIISLGKKIILVEGNLDQKTYGIIASERYPDFIVVPCGSKNLLRYFNQISENILNRSIKGVDFFCIVDRDADMPKKKLETLEGSSEGQSAVLKRYSLENYFLDEEIWYNVWKSGEAITPEKLKEFLKNHAKERLSEIIRRTILLEINTNISGINVNASGTNLCEFKKEFLKDFGERKRELENKLKSKEIENKIEKLWKSFEDALNDPEDKWKEKIPAKEYLNKFINQNLGIKKKVAYDLYLQEAQKNNFSPFKEIINIFKEFQALDRDHS